MDWEKINKKNLNIETGKKKENVLETGKKKGAITTDYADKNKKIDKEKLINKQTVWTGLRAEDAEHFGDIQDADLHRANIYNFENTPEKRLNWQEESRKSKMEV